MAKYPKSINENDDPYLLIELFDKDCRIGDIVVIKTRYGFWETHASIDAKYHGQGLGVKLYRKAILECQKRKIRISSSDHYSPMAERVWTSSKLRNEFKIRKNKKRFMVLGQK